jgi:hypothetical protein
MLTGVLCSSNCAVEAVCQLFLLLLHAQGLQNVHTAWYTLRLLLGRPGTRESAGNHPTTNLLSLNCSVAAPPARCVQVLAACTGFVNHVNTAKLLMCTPELTHWNRYADVP